METGKLSDDVREDVDEESFCKAYAAVLERHSLGFQMLAEYDSGVRPKPDRFKK